MNLGGGGARIGLALGLLGRLLRQRDGVRDAPSDPGAQAGLGGVARRRDEEPSRRGAADVERLRAGPPEQGIRLRRLDSDDEVAPVHADGHVAAEEERDAAEHFLLGDARLAPENGPDAVRLSARVAHASRERVSPHEAWREAMEKTPSRRAENPRYKRV